MPNGVARRVREALGIWILEIGSESLLAVVKDDLDVERVQLIPFGPAG